MYKLFRALDFAGHAHANQRRKYTDEPYINHCIEVVKILVEQGIVDENMLCAAALHDVVEDTKYTLLDICALFGGDVATLVEDLTDVSKPYDGNRAHRKAIDREHTANASLRAKTIKLADLISNTRTIAKFDHSFAKIYLAEKALLLPHLKAAHLELWGLAAKTLQEAQYHVENEKLQEALK